jgi:type I restriction enzyme S subunit
MTVRLGDVVDINPRGEFGELKDESEVGFVPMSAVCEYRKTVVAPEIRMFADVRKGYTPMRNGDIILAKITPCFENGKVARVNLPQDISFGSTEFHVFRSHPEINADLVFHLLRSDMILQFGRARMKGAAGQKRVPSEFFRAFEFRVPRSILAQQRVARILDAADALRAKRREALTQLDTLLQSTFLTLFGDPVTNPMGWPKTSIENLVDNIDSGWSPTCLDRSATDDEWGVLKLGAVTYCEYRENQTKALPHELTPRPEIEVRKGDLLFTRKNTYDLVAACAYVHETRPKLMLPDLIFRIRLSKSHGTEPTFIWQQLIFPRLRKHIQTFAGGAAGSMPNISKAKLRAIELITPPLPLQQKFAAIVESIERQKTTQRAHLAELDALFAALQHRAFRGEL